MRTHGTLGRLIAPARGPASASLAILLLMAVAGCGARQAEQASTASQSKAESSTEASAQSEAESSTLASALPEVVAAAQDVALHRAASRSAGPIHRITLTDRRCVRFEPQWSSVRVGQSVTWHSDLKSTVRIYISPGVFARESYLVRPGATVTTGPALAVGRFSFWTEPSACREAPRGVLLAGPGVRVLGTYYASTGPR